MVWSSHFVNHSIWACQLVENSTFIANFIVPYGQLNTDMNSKNIVRNISFHLNGRELFALVAFLEKNHINFAR